MENAIYNSMFAANQLLEKQTIISNNLANISTNGFKEKFNYILQNNNLKNSYNHINKVIREFYSPTPGMLYHTERNLDLFIKDSGWLTVKDKNGQEAYTKNGHLKINSKRKLVIQDNEVIGHHCNITIPNNANVKISSNGVINITEKKNKKIFKTKIGQLKLVNFPIKDMIQKENGFFYPKSYKNSKNIINHDNNIRVRTGFLESSNVNPSQNMIEMISNARQFEMQMKMISTLDHNSEYANQLININN